MYKYLIVEFPDLVIRSLADPDDMYIPSFFRPDHGEGTGDQGWHVMYDRMHQLLKRNPIGMRRHPGKGKFKPVCPLSQPTL